MKKILLIFCMTLATFVVANAQNDEITNATILELLGEGFSSQEIIGMIETSSTRTINYSIDFMRKLKAAGADATLTTFIQKIAKADNGYEGVLWWNTGNNGKPQKIYRSQFEKEQKGFSLGTLALAAVTGVAVGSAISGDAPSSGVGAALGAGTVLLASSGKDIEKLCIMGAKSKNVVRTKQPIFRFYLPKHDPTSFQKEADNWYYGIMNEIQSPNEFQIVKMKTKKNRRVFTDGASWGVAGFSSSNSKGRVVVDFAINEINNNTFEITFNQPLEPGEYVFFWKNGLANETFKQHVFGFDFCIE
ncbi:MAG: hypothetical protein KBT06_11140 [Prevotellaceae bacterium]|nr:hypothetical protein [Candidatus Colivivens equi]